MKRLFYRILQSFQASSQEDKLPKLVSSLEVAPKLNVEYAIFESKRPIKLSGLIDISTIEVGDEVSVSLFAGPNFDDLGLVREVVLTGPVKEKWLRFEEHFFPAAKIILKQSRGRSGKLFRTFWYAG